MMTGTCCQQCRSVFAFDAAAVKSHPAHRLSNDLGGGLDLRHGDRLLRPVTVGSVVSEQSRSAIRRRATLNQRRRHSTCLLRFIVCTGKRTLRSPGPGGSLRPPQTSLTPCCNTPGSAATRCVGMDYPCNAGTAKYDRDDNLT